MKPKALPLVFSISLFLSAPAWGDSVSDAAAAGVIGGMAGVAVATGGSRNAPPAQAFLGTELSDWIDPATGVTSRLSDACGHAIELRLSRGLGRNILNVTLSNRSGATSTFDGNQVLVHFESGLTRRLIPIGQGDASLPKGWWAFRALGFPSKEDFRDQNRLVVEFPIQSEGGSTCTVKVEALRSCAVSTDPRTYVSHTDGDIFLEAGPTVAASGGLRRLGAQHGGQLDLGFVVWPWVNHGFSLDVLIEAYGGSGAAAVLPERTLVNPGISAMGFFLGYNFRLYAARWLSASYGIAFGSQLFELNDDNQRNNSYLTTFLSPLRERLAVTFAFARLADGSEFALAPAVVHTFVPFGSYGQVDASGHSLTVLLRLGMGE